MTELGDDDFVQILPLAPFDYGETMREEMDKLMKAIYESFRLDEWALSGKPRPVLDLYFGDGSRWDEV